jgi:hypothetical protein
VRVKGGLHSESPVDQLTLMLKEKEDLNKRLTKSDAPLYEVKAAYKQLADEDRRPSDHFTKHCQVIVADEDSGTTYKILRGKPYFAWKAAREAARLRREREGR